MLLLKGLASVGAEKENKEQELAGGPGCQGRPVGCTRGPHRLGQRRWAVPSLPLTGDFPAVQGVLKKIALGFSSPATVTLAGRSLVLGASSTSLGTDHFQPCEAQLRA